MVARIDFMARSVDIQNRYEVDFASFLTLNIVTEALSDLLHIRGPTSITDNISTT